MAVAQDLFVHHFGSRIFTGNGVDANRLLDKNTAKFAAKWGNAVPQKHRVTLRPFSPRPQTHQEGAIDPQMSQRDADGNDKGLHSVPLPSADRARVSLTMIVRDEEENLPHGLGSVHGLFDEIVVVDTGSKDRTIEIARSFGARVFHFTWVDDFAAALNVALQQATGDYAFWLDADDVLEPAERVKLEALLARLRGSSTVSIGVFRG
jgi:cellulose synthase/poly-beta-1,6-N-acetylglucosamine synthase-like glycosyltransferase